MCPYRIALIEAIIEGPRETEHWAQKYHGSDAFVPEPLGDGKQLVHLTPLATRPWCYVLMVDSSWDDLAEHTEEMYEAIEMEYGHCDDTWYPEDDEPEEPPEWWGTWPALNDHCGCTWGMHYWPTFEGEWLDPYYFIADSENLSCPSC